MDTKACRKCHEVKPCNAQFFGHTPKGSLRHVCRVCMAANNRRLHAINPEKTQARRERYKQHLQLAKGSYTDLEISEIRRNLGDSCFYCGVPLQGGGEKDHIIPLSKGGSNWSSNITLACLSCNRDKYNKSVSEFIKWKQERGLKISRRCYDYLYSEKNPAFTESI
ncbi:MAG: hypothetical protein DYH15_14000 [Nitrosomonas sp. PRO4]|nr:hypothetical protein [Nitrosomonas sp. PRO4]